MYYLIKYSYFPKDKLFNNILESIKTILDEYGDFIDNYKIIDNIKHGMRVYPEDIQRHVENCSWIDLHDKVSETIKDESIDFIFINNFNIDLDELRYNYSKLTEDSNVIFIFNEGYDNDKVLTFYIDEKIHKLSENEWIDLKKDIDNNIKEELKDSTGSQEVLNYIKEKLNIPKDYDGDSIVPIKKIKKIKKYNDYDIDENYGDINYDKIAKILDKTLNDYKFNLTDNCLYPSIDKYNIENDIVYTISNQGEEFNIIKTSDNKLILDNGVCILSLNEIQIEFLKNILNNYFEF